MNALNSICFTLLVLCATAWPATKHPAEEQGARSTADGAKAIITFVNESARDIRIYWLNYEGERDLKGALADGESFSNNTLVTHPWIITDSEDNALSIHYPDPNTAAIEIVTPGRIDSLAGVSLEGLKEKAQASDAVFQEAAKQLSDSPEKLMKLWHANDRTEEKLRRAAVELARWETDAGATFAALQWAMDKPRAFYQPSGQAALDMLTARFATHPEIVKIVARIGPFRASNNVGIALCQAVLAQHPDPVARGHAAFVLAEKSMANYREASTEGAEMAAGEAAAAYEAVVRDYGSQPLLFDASLTLGGLAERALFELRHLRVGMTAPDIVGADLDGVHFNLSDTRGKVTALVFWASWCGPCMAMVPHERVLVERMQGRPFTLIGVNGDYEREKGQQTTAQERMTWRSFWNGGPDGEISRAWNVIAWPTVYVLDEKGVIRAKGVRDEALDQAVEQLVKKSEALKPK